MATLELIEIIAAIVGVIVTIIGIPFSWLARVYLKEKKEHIKSLTSQIDALVEERNEYHKALIKASERAIERAERYAETVNMYAQILRKK